MYVTSACFRVLEEKGDGWMDGWMDGKRKLT